MAAVVRSKLSALGQAALALAARVRKLGLGKGVLPLRQGGKIPLIKEWQKRAALDEGIIRSWWTRWPTANLGIGCGNGLLVLDVDTKDGALGPESLADLEATHEPLPTTVVVSTPTGGAHWYFKVCPVLKFVNRVGKLGPGLDIRSDGGQVVAPPSTRKEGAYTWASPPGTGIAPAPLWLVELTAEKAEPRPVERPEPRPASETPPPSPGELGTVRLASTWIADVKARVDVPTVARELGLVSGKGESLGPCPACKAERRGKREKRGPIGYSAEGWTCHRGDCDAKGSVVDLVAYKLTGRRLDARDKAQALEVLAWCASHGWCEPAWTGHETSPRPPLPPPKPRPPEKRARPDPAEVAALWEACRPVTEDDQVATWLRSRGLDPVRIADPPPGLARALPADLRPPRLPQWARYSGRPWTLGWRCVLPAWGPTGNLESLRARWVRDKGELPEGTNKEGAAAAGFGSATGLVLADALGRQILETGKAPSWWAGSAFEVWIVEGSTDFLALAARWPEGNERAPAVMGVWDGAWTAEIAARIPDKARVIVATDQDDKGEEYAEQIRKSLPDRCELLRRRPGGANGRQATRP